MRRSKTSPASQGHKRPDGLYHSERPRSLQEAVGRTERTRRSECEHKPMAAILQGVADEHCGDGKQSKGSQGVHGQSYPAHRIHVTIRDGSCLPLTSHRGGQRSGVRGPQRATGIDGLCSLTRPPNLGSDFPRSLAGPPVFLRAMISERRACADSDFICTGLKKPVRARYASPGASLRSVLWVSVRACS